MVSTEPLLLECLPLAEIEIACRRETELYRRHEPSDGRYCLEIFRRALAHTDESLPRQHDEAARELLVRIYSEFIKANINRAALHRISLDDLVQQVWLRFWQAVRSGKMFPSLEAALNYLKLVTASALIEEQRRARDQWRSESLEQRVAQLGEKNLSHESIDPFSEHVKQRFRDRCRELLADPLEHQVFYHRYSMGFAPREIASALAREGVLLKAQPPTARAISDLLDRIFKRLQDDPEIQDLLRDD